MWCRMEEVGKMYVSLLCSEITDFIRNDIPSERFLVMSKLLLIRDPRIKQARDVKVLIEKRINSWKNGDIKILMQEARRCSAGIERRVPQVDATLKRFANMIQRGETRSGTRLITDRIGGLCAYFRF